jgi:hypothetical protein
MELDATVLATVGGVLLILLAVILYNNQRAAKARTEGAGPAGPAGAPDTWVGRYVHHAGSVVGRVAAVEENRIIIERAGERRAFALLGARPMGNDIEYTGAFEWDAAKTTGVVIEDGGQHA